MKKKGKVLLLVLALIVVGGIGIIRFRACGDTRNVLTRISPMPVNPVLSSNGKFQKSAEGLYENTCRDVCGSDERCLAACGQCRGDGVPDENAQGWSEQKDLVCVGTANESCAVIAKWKSSWTTCQGESQGQRIMTAITTEHYGEDTFGSTCCINKKSESEVSNNYACSCINKDGQDMGPTPTSVVTEDTYYGACSCGDVRPIQKKKYVVAYDNCEQGQTSETTEFYGESACE